MSPIEDELGTYIQIFWAEPAIICELWQDSVNFNTRKGWQ